MIGRLRTRFEKLDVAIEIAAGARDRAEQVIRRQMIRAGRTHEESVACEQLRTEKIEFPVGRFALRDVLANEVKVTSKASPLIVVTFTSFAAALRSTAARAVADESTQVASAAPCFKAPMPHAPR